MRIRHRIVAIIIKNNKLLLVKGKKYSELWTPGGKVENGETEKETLVRELKEEVNLKLLSLNFFRKYFLKSPYDVNWMTETKCFLVKAGGDPKPGREIESIIWFSKDDFFDKKYPMIEENDKFLIPDLIKEKLLK